MIKTKLEGLLQSGSESAPAVAPAPSLLEQMLSDKARLKELREKYNVKDPREMRMPTMQWVGDNNS